MITLLGATKFYPPDQFAINQVNLQIDEGEMIFLMGHSGAGKSTLLKLISGLEEPTRGQVIVDGRNLGQINSKRLPELRRSIGILLQNPWLLNEESVFDNVALPLRIVSCPWRERDKRVRAALKLVGLNPNEMRPPCALSTGEQQRVALARALVIRPKILLADEPTGNLDPELSEQLVDKFMQLNEMGTTMIIATHDRDLANSNEKRTLILEHGRLKSDVVAKPRKECGVTDELLEVESSLSNDSVVISVAAESPVDLKSDNSGSPASKPAAADEFEGKADNPASKVEGSDVDRYL